MFRSASNKWLAVGALAAVVLLVVNVVLTYHNTQKLFRHGLAVAHTHEVMRSLDRTLLLMQDAETGQRGYLITGEERYLAPHRSAVAGVNQQVDEFERLAGDDPFHRQRLPELRSLIAAKLEELDRTIALRKSAGHDGAREAVLTDQGKSEMDRFRSLVGQLTGYEQNLRNHEISEQNRLFRVTVLEGLLSGVCALLATGAFLGLLRRHLATRTQAAATIAEQAERLRTTLASIGDAVIATDTHCHVTMMNEVAEALTGWTAADANGKTIETVFRIVDESTRQLVPNPCAAALKAGAVVGLAQRTLLIAKDGTERPIDDSASPIRCAEGQMVGCVLIFRDVSERRRTEHLEANQRAVLELVARDAPLPAVFHELIWMMQRQSDAGMLGSILVLDDDGKHLRHGAGPSLPDAYNQAIDGVEIGPAVGSCGTAAFLQKPVYVADIATDPLWKDFAELATSHGLHACWSTPIFARDGKLLGTFAMYYPQSRGANEHDLLLAEVATRVAAIAIERKRAEADLRQAKEEAESANLAKDNFLATLSHELRTPLTPVLASLGEWEEKPEFPESMREDLTMVRRNVELEARLIDDLLDLTRIVRGKIAMNMEVLDVQALLDSLLVMYRSEIDAKRIELTMKAGARNCHVRADPGRLQQAFWNVLKNAVKFTPAGGRIELTTCNGDAAAATGAFTSHDTGHDNGDGNGDFKGDGEFAHGTIQIVVQDSGIGFSGEMLGRLFRPFEQENSSHLKQYGGLGLGLAITKSLLEAQGGNIEAHSEGPSCGARFVITLPCVEAPSSTMPASDDATPDRVDHAEVAPERGYRVLLVEDHADTARVLARLLRSNGHVVTTSASVAGAIEAMREGPFDVLLSDIGLPDGTGIDLIRQVRDRYGLTTPAVALTGFGMEDDVERCREAGFRDHLTKPISVARLEETIRRVCEAGD